MQTATFGKFVAQGKDQKLWNRHFKQVFFSFWYIKWLYYNKANRSKLWRPSVRKQNPECPPVSMCPECTRLERAGHLCFWLFAEFTVRKVRISSDWTEASCQLWEQAGKQFKEQKNSCLWRCPVFLSVGVDIYVTLGKMMPQTECLIGGWLAGRSDSRL